MLVGTQGRRGTASLGRSSVLCLAAVLAACAGGSPGQSGPAVVPSILLAPNGNGWSAAPTSNRLKKVSNNGFGYTGQIDQYELTAPATGRLQFSLTWDHDANFDLIVASDEGAHVRLVEGLEDTNEPEYVGLDVVAGQRLFLFVAGWTGDPGPYVLDIFLLPPAAPLFDIESAPDFSGPLTADRPFTFTFTTDLDPDQDFEGRIYLVHAGGVVEGTWCAEGRDLTFYPHLPETASDAKGLLPGQAHVLQFPRAARGVRAATGEYLTDLLGFGFSAAQHEDLWPGAPGIVGITPSPAASYHGEPITIAFSEPLDPATVVPQLLSVAGDGSTAPLPFHFHLTQTYLCSGGLEVRLLIAPDRAPAAGTTTRLTLPAGTLALGGGPPLGLGAGVTVDFPPP